MINQNLAKVCFYFWFKFLWMYVCYRKDQHDKLGQHKDKTTILVEDVALAMFSLGQIMGICGKNPNWVNEKMIRLLKDEVMKNMQGLYRNELVFSKDILPEIEVPFWCRAVGLTHVSYMLDKSRQDYPFGVLELEFNQNPFMRIDLDLDLDELFIDNHKDILEHRDRALMLLLKKLDIATWLI